MSASSASKEKLMGLLICDNFDGALQLLAADSSLLEAPLDHSGRMAFHFFFREPELAERFLSLGADPNQRDPDGRTALFNAGSPDVAEYLIAEGADVAVRDNQGRTVLFTCKENFLDLYLAAGLSLDDQDLAGRTPAHDRVWSNAALESLVSRGASIDIADNNGVTPLHTRAAAMLPSRASDLKWDVRDNDGDTPLHHAFQAGDGWWMHKLRELGASDEPNNAGKLPMDLAVGRLALGARQPAPVVNAVLRGQLFEGQLIWEFESNGFGLSDADGPIENPGPHDLVDFRLYSERLHKLSGRRFDYWPELFADPIIVDAGPEKNAALYRHEHLGVDNSIIVGSAFNSTSFQLDWRGRVEDSEDFHLSVLVEFDGIRVHPYSTFGEQANSSPNAFAEALSPYLPAFNDRYLIEPVVEHRARFRAVPLMAGE